MDTETISGLVERVTYHNSENGYCVLQIKSSRRRDLITIIGHASTISPGEFVQASGNWVDNKVYGPQFKATFLKTTAPTTEEGIEKFLASGMVKGIRKFYAKKLVNTFGTDIFNIIEETPEELLNVEGIGPHRMEMIVKSWKEQKSVREIMVFLHQHGVSTVRAVRIYKTFGSDAIRVISENPYCLAREIRGIGFISADQIAQKMGIAKDSLMRVQAGLNHVLLESMDQGHCALPNTELLARAKLLLDVADDVLLRALHEEITSEALVQDTIKDKLCIFLKGLYFSEQAIARSLQELNQDSPPWGEINCSKAIARAENALSLRLSNGQKEAIKKALSNKVTIITGGPGVGKTTMVKSLLAILIEQKIEILLCAPTGRAAKRLSECTGGFAKTIHRLLEVDPSNGKFKRNAFNPLECDLLIVDEVSMIDVPLFFSLLKAIPTDAALFLIGDVDQLPSVGPGNVLRDIISALPVAKLDEVFRQAQSSQIIINAHRANKGIMPLVPEKGEKSDFYFIVAEENADALDKVIEVVKNRIPKHFGFDSSHDIQILCPMNRSLLGARNLNSELQKILNPEPKEKVERYGKSFGCGDKVMQTINNYDKEVYNGDIGFITKIDADQKEVLITFDGRDVCYEFDELDEIVLAYVITIHKSQGSEYPVVVIPLTMQHYPMLKRNLLYTGMTRGKKLVVIIGQRKALAMAVKEQSAGQRYSKLSEWFNELNA